MKIVWNKNKTQLRRRQNSQRKLKLITQMQSLSLRMPKRKYKKLEVEDGRVFISLILESSVQ